MNNVEDHQGRAIRLTDERLTHILEHPEMKDLAEKLGDALARPELMIQSLSDFRTPDPLQGSLIGQKFINNSCPFV